MNQISDDQHMLLFTVAGPDGPGITAKLMSVIHDSGDILRDMGQAVTHGLLSLSFLVEIKNRTNGESNVVKELLYQASLMNLNVTFQKIEKTADLPGVSPKIAGDKFILNCVAPEDITALFISDVARALSDNGINIGDKFTIVRAGKEIGKIEISRTQPTVSIAVYKKGFPKPPAPFKSGDKVMKIN